MYEITCELNIIKFALILDSRISVKRYFMFQYSVYQKIE